MRRRTLEWTDLIFITLLVISLPLWIIPLLVHKILDSDQVRALYCAIFGHSPTTYYQGNHEYEQCKECGYDSQTKTYQTWCIDRRKY